MFLLAVMAIGVVAGLYATRSRRMEASPVAAIGIGLIGAILGGFIARALVAVLGLAAGLLGAALGALLLIWFYQRHIRK